MIGGPYASSEPEALLPLADHVVVGEPDEVFQEGSRRFATRDDSTNNWFVALLTFGEGWHNNHHAHPTSARHGLKWYEIDMNWYGIWTLKIFGLATQIKRERRPVATRSFAASDLIT